MKKLTFPVAAAAAAALWTGIFALGHSGCSSENNPADPDGASGIPDSGPGGGGCNQNLSCQSALECGTGQCKSGKCDCGGGGGACHADSDCTGAAKCCNLVTNQCYQCDTDGGSTDTQGSTDASGKPDTGGGGDPGPKDTGTQEEPNACANDFQCQNDPQAPYCNTAMGLCVQCYLDGHCPGSTCNTTTFTCAGGFDAGTDDTGTTDTGTPDAGDACSGYSCLCDSYCMVQGGTPTCVSGCRNVGDCCTGHDCVNGSCVSTTCGSDADCTGALPHCDTGSGECRECVYDSHCANGYYCDQFSYTCQLIIDNCNPPCDPSTEYCDSNTLTCVPKVAGMCQPCANFLDCLPFGLSCGAFTKVCTKQCTLDSDCQGYTCGIVGFCTCP